MRRTLLYAVALAIAINLALWGVRSYRHFEWVHVNAENGTRYAVPAWRK